MKEVTALHRRQNIGGGCWHGVHVDEHGATTVFSPPGNLCSPIQGLADPIFVEKWQEATVQISPLALNNNIGGGSKHPESRPRPDGRVLALPGLQLMGQLKDKMFDRDVYLAQFAMCKLCLGQDRPAIQAPVKDRAAVGEGRAQFQLPK
jgi:hypothetical protein